MNSRWLWFELKYTHDCIKAVMIIVTFFNWINISDNLCVICNMRCFVEADKLNNVAYLCKIMLMRSDTNTSGGERVTFY